MKAKKVLAMLMASAMIFGMAMTTWAASSTETATVTVKNVTEQDAVVTAYQLVYYDDESQTYEVVEDAKNLGYVVGMDDATIVSEIAEAISNGNAHLTGTTLSESRDTITGELTDDYTGELTAGTYLILVTNSSDTIYNPMLVSLEVEYPDGVQDGEVDADDDYIVNSTVVYAKSTDNVPIDKIITDESGNQIGENGKYDDVYSGTEVWFKITGTIPSYSEQYDNDSLTYTITDTVSDGLTLAEDLEETLQAQVGADVAKVSVEGNTITIDYTNDYIMKHGNTQVTITYPAVVNGTSVNFDAATNTVNVTYSNSPSSTTNGEEKVTRHYTFDLENALVKVDENDEQKALEGAEFQLTSNTDESKVFTSTSDEDGYIEFKGLDAGEYTLVETKAPEGYSISDVEYTVSITPTYDDNDELVSYTVTVTDPEGTEMAEIVYTTTDQDGNGDPAKIENTTLTSLPSTGGIGTTIFTIGGCVIMVTAAGLYFATRKKEHNA